MNLRSAVSIARRLQDPLAELVKIPEFKRVEEAKRTLKALIKKHGVEIIAIGNGTAGKETEIFAANVIAELDLPVSYMVVSEAGASVYSASKLAAEEFPEYDVNLRSAVSIARRLQDPLAELVKIDPKAFEQCAGFLRVPGAKNPLDATAVHPESYGAAEKLLALCGLSPADIGTPAARELEQQAKRLGHGKLAAELGVGVPTLEDMIEELLRPGRDMRDSLPKPLLRTDVLDMKDLTPGMQLTGTVRNVIDFGAFVDIGVHQDGLVHISQISSRFIRHPSEVLKVGDVVTVWVLSVDLQKKRIALTMKQPKTEQAH